MPVCQKCKVDKPDTDFWYRKDRNKLRGTCKQCMNKQNRNYVEVHKEEVTEYIHNYHKENKDVISIRKAEYYIENKEEISEVKKAWYFKRRDYVIAKVKQYAIDNYAARKHQERTYRENNKEVLKIRKAEYYQTPEGKASKLRCHYRRKKYIDIVECTLTASQFQRIIESQNNKCIGFPRGTCGKTFTEEDPATRDHIIPVSLEGPFTFENTQALCQSCNSRKQNKLDKNILTVWIDPLTKHLV